MADRPGKRILLIRLSAIGDVVVTTPVSRALREALPDAFIAWVVEPRAKPIVDGNPYVDEVIEWERPKGTLTPGKLADVVVLTKDVLSCPEEEIRTAKVAYTIVGGKVRFAAE